MNNTRRKEIEKILTRLGDLKTDVETIYGEEEEYFENMPENLVASDKGERAEEVVGLIDGAIMAFDEIEDALTEAAN